MFFWTGQTGDYYPSTEFWARLSNGEEETDSNWCLGAKEKSAKLWGTSMQTARQVYGVFIVLDLHLLGHQNFAIRSVLHPELLVNGHNNSLSPVLNF